MQDLVSTDDMQKYTDTAIEMIMGYGPKLMLAIIVLFVGLWIINRFTSLMSKGMERSNTEPTLARFLRNLVSIGLKALLLISVAGMIGIQTTSFIAVLGAAGLAVGLALQGSLANFAGGVLVLMFRPFKVGDYIEAQGVGGTVKEIQILHTLINTPDNKRIIVPNGALSNNIITNYSAEPRRRVDFVFGIGYDDDIGRARDVIRAEIEKDERVFDDPAPQIVIGNLGDSSVDFTVRVWANASDYWGIKFDLTERVKLAFDEAGVSIPFPQRDVHLYSEQAG
ncbi:MAG: mechanosensitive ion channel [Pseudomonadales bacterium]